MGAGCRSRSANRVQRILERNSSEVGDQLYMPQYRAIRGRLLRFGASAVPEAAAIVKTFAATMAISGGDTRDPEIGREREEEIPGD